MSVPAVPKRLLRAPLIGEQGVAVAKLLTLEMGSTWHETNPMLESGIDAMIELRDPETGVMLNRWAAAQSRAHQGPFKAESDASFTFECTRRDLAYWADVNAPVILIVSRPEERAAWWRAISPELQQVAEPPSRCPSISVVTATALRATWRCGVAAVKATVPPEPVSPWASRRS